MDYADEQLQKSVDPSTDFLSKIMPTIKGNMTAQEQSEIPDWFASMGAIKKDALEGKDIRTQLYETLSGQQDKLTAHKRETLVAMAEDKQMTKPQIAAMMMISLLPTLVGGIVGGKKGIAKGAEAGALGTQVMSQGLSAERDRRDAINKETVSTIDSQLSSNSKSMTELMLNQADANDTMASKEADRATTLQAASIRAGGEASAGKAIAQELRNVSISLDNNKKGSEANARNKPFQVGDKIFQSTGSLTDDAVKDIRDVSDNYATILDSIQKMKESNTAADFGAFSRLFGDTSTEMSMLHSDALNALENIKKVPGSLGSGNIKRLETMLKDPTSVWNNIISATPARAGVADQLKMVEQILTNDLTRFMETKGTKAVPLGKEMVMDGAKYKLTGISPTTGKPVWTKVTE